jgi:outer membrane lipase/esterase
MNRRILLASTAIFGLLSTSAQAGTLYVFGDSLSDDGNLYALTGQPPAPYYNGRFSNGPVWVEYLPGLTGLNFSSSTDYAYGGAFTGTISGSNNLDGVGLPGITTEIAGFAAAGGAFNNADVVTLWGGANNYFAYATTAQTAYGSGGLSAAQAVVTSAVTSTITQLTGDVSALIGLGAQTLIVPNLPDLGVTPSFNTSAIGIQLGDAFSVNHDAALPIEMAMLHQSTGANIIVLNTEQLLNNVVASPSTYGFTDVTDACTAVLACVGGTTATQNTYLFWDSVHPTTHAQNIIAQYAADSLIGYQDLAIPGQLGTQAITGFTGLLDQRLVNLSAGASGASYNVGGATASAPLPNNNISLFISETGNFGAQAAKGQNAGFTSSTETTSAGLEDHVSDTTVAGGAIGYALASASPKTAGSVNDDALEFGAYGAFTGPAFYARASAAVAENWYKTQTPAYLGGSVTGKPSGLSIAIQGAAGYAYHPRANFSVGPELGLIYSHVGLNGYTESGDALLTKQVASQTDQSLDGTAGLRLGWSGQFRSLQLTPYALLGAELPLSGHGGDFTADFTSSSLVPLTIRYPAQSSVWAIYQAGTSVALSRRLSANVAVAGTAFRSTGNNVSVSGALSWTF